MHKYEARIHWERQGASFLDNRFSRAHEWRFDGGLSVPASSSPSSTPEPMSVAANIDPEEALVAAASSCHMLWFLYLAGKRGFVVDSYTDEAYGVMAKNGDGRLAITRVVLRPRVVFGGERGPSKTEIDALHHESHERCFIANSLKSEVVIEGN
ncbi:MAG: OsmC family protein [Sulfurifustaceae bacterium]